MNQLSVREKRTAKIPILMNSSNHIGNSTFRYQLPASGVTLTNDDEVALVNLNIYFSWRNITSDYGNNKVTLTFGASVFDVTFPNGNYSVEDINTYLYWFMKKNGLSTSTTDVSGVLLDVYFIKLIINPTEYKIQLLADPTTGVIPGTPNTPQITFNAAFGKLIGFNAGTYPQTPQPTKYEVLSNSNIVSQISPVESILVRTNLISNGSFSIAPDLLSIFTAGTSKYGSLIEVAPNDLLWVNTRSGLYNYFDIKFVDNNFNNLQMLDFDLTIMLMLKVTI